MIQPGISVSGKGRQPKTTDGPVIHYLYQILQAIKGKGSCGVTTGQYDKLSAETLTIPADTISNLSFSVILGSVSLSMDGGSTSVTYPIGYNGNLSNDCGFANSFIFTVGGTLGDGLNETIIQVVNL